MPKLKLKTTLPKIMDAESDDGLVLNLRNHVQKTKSKRGKAQSPPGENRVVKPVGRTRRFSGRLAATTSGARKPLAEKDINEDEMTATTFHIPQCDDSRTKQGSASEVDRPKRSRGRPSSKKTKTVKDSATEAQGPGGSAGAQPKPPNSPRVLSSEIPTLPDVDSAVRWEAQMVPETQPDAPDYYLATCSTFQRIHPAKDSREHVINRKSGYLSSRPINFEAKYYELRDIGINEAERNFDRLKMQTDNKSMAASELIASLKAELACLSTVASETEDLRAQLHASRTRIAALEEDNGALTAFCAEARDKVKSLSARLAVSRSADATLENSSRSHPSGSRPPINVESFRASQLKEELYADLTGLLIRDVKSCDSGTVYDCIQTGRNGTLHFKLLVSHDSGRGRFEEEQVTYKPQLDKRRDEDLVDLLPDYLVDEITFARPHAAKFYARVTKSLTEVEDAP